MSSDFYSEAGGCVAAEMWLETEVPTCRNVGRHARMVWWRYTGFRKHLCSPAQSIKTSVWILIRCV